MSFDLELDFAQMMYQAQNPNLRKGSSELKEIESLTRSVLLCAVPDACLVVHDPWIKEAHDGDRYRRKCSDLIQASTLEAMTFQKSLPNLQRAEEFAKEYAELKKDSRLNGKSKKLNVKPYPPRIQTR